MELARKKKPKANTGIKGLALADKQISSLKRIARIKGQIEGIERMLLEGRYCPDILQQVKSASSALKGLECEILEGHIRGCVKQAFAAKDPYLSEQKIAELVNLLRSR